MERQGYLAKEHLALLTKTFHDLELEREAWERVASPTLEEEADHYCRLLDLVQPLQEANEAIERRRHLNLETPKRDQL